MWLDTYLQSKLYIAMLLCLLLFWKIAVYLLRKPYDDLIVSSNYMHCSHFFVLSFESFSLSSIEVVWLISRSKQTGACFLPSRITIGHNCLWSLCLHFFKLKICVVSQIYTFSIGCTNFVFKKGKKVESNILKSLISKQSWRKWKYLILVW